MHPTLHVSTNQATLTSTSDVGTTQDVTVTLPWHATDFIADVTSSDEGFLTVSQPNATTLRLQARAMPSGQRTALVRVRADVFTENVLVTYNVTPPVGGEFNLRSNPSSISVSAIERTDVAPIDIAVSGPTWEPGLPTVAYEDYHGFSIAWLQLQKTATGYRITPTAGQLNAGTHTASILIRGDNTAVPSSNITIPVTFTVGEGLAQPANVERTLDANTTLQSPELRGSVPVTLAGGPPVQWTADFRPFTRWFTLTRPVGHHGHRRRIRDQPGRDESRLQLARNRRIRGCDHPDDALSHATHVPRDRASEPGPHSRHRAQLPGRRAAQPAHHPRQRLHRQSRLGRAFPRHVRPRRPGQHHAGE